MHFPSSTVETLLLSLPTALDAALANQASRTGQTKTAVIIEALQQYLSNSTTAELKQQAETAPATAAILRQLEQRLAKLERQAMAKSVVQPPALPHEANADEEEIYDEPDEILESFLPTE